MHVEVMMAVVDTQILAFTVLLLGHGALELFL